MHSVSWYTDGDIMLLAPDASVAREYFSSPSACELSDGGIILLEPSRGHVTSFQSNMKVDVYIRKELYAMSPCQMARPCSKGFCEHDEGTASPWCQTFPLRGSVVPTRFTGRRVHVTSFQNNMECDVCIRKYSYVYAVLSSGTNMVPEALSA